MADFVLRFVIGGLVVSAFAALGDVLKPKSFAGLFGAAPSVALATLGLTIHAHGRIYAATEARSMIIGALAFCIYAFVSSWLLMRLKISALKATTFTLFLWLVCSISVWYSVLR